MNLFGAAQAVMTVNPHVTYRICVFLGTATAAEIVIYLMIGVIKVAAQNAKLVATARTSASVPQDITEARAILHALLVPAATAARIALPCVPRPPRGGRGARAPPAHGAIAP